MRRAAAAIAVVAALVVLLGTTACGRDPVPQVGVTRIDAGDRQPAPPIAGTTLAGDPLALADLGGRIVVLNNWASWCAPCREEVPILVDAARNAGSDVTFVGLNVTDEPAAAKDFAAETGMDYPSIADPKGDLLATIPGVPAKALPSTVVIDARGRIAARVIGKVSAADLARIIGDLRAEGGA